MNFWGKNSRDIAFLVGIELSRPNEPGMTYEDGGRRKTAQS